MSISPADYEADNEALGEAIAERPTLKCKAQEIFDAPGFDACPEVLCVASTYRRLAELIPTDWTVYDLGCAYAFQSLYFEDHRAYVGVDVLTPVANRLVLPNSRHYHGSIKDFLKTERIGRCAFGICNWVPPWSGGSGELVRQAFGNLFVMYPDSTEVPAVPRWTKEQP